VAPVLQAGFNPLDEAERLKAKKRLERFHDNLTEKVAEVESEEKLAKRSAKFGIPIKSKVEGGPEKSLEILKKLRLKPQQVYRNDDQRKDPPLSAPGVVSREGICGHKLHLFALHVDKDILAKFRSPDLMHYLKAFNPT
jgi:hypothetical protein